MLVVAQAVLRAEVAGADEHQARIDFLHRVDDAVVLLRVLAELHVAKLPLAPHFVADAPVLDAVRLGVAVLRRATSRRSCRRRRCVFDFLGGRVVVAEAGVDGDHRLGADFAAEVDEFVDADVVVLDAGPGGILARRPAVAGADAVAPVVAAHEVAAGPAVDRAR